MDYPEGMILSVGAKMTRLRALSGLAERAGNSIPLEMVPRHGVARRVGQSEACPSGH